MGVKPNIETTIKRSFVSWFQGVNKLFRMRREYTYGIKHIPDMGWQGVRSNQLRSRQGALTLKLQRMQSTKFWDPWTLR